MCIVQRLCGLQFDEDHLLDQQVEREVADDRVFMSHRYALLLHNLKPNSTKLQREGILIDLFHKADA